MKKSIAYVLVLSILAACGGKQEIGKLADLQKSLAEKEAQVSKLNQEIKEINEKIAQLDPNAASAGKTKLVTITELKTSSFRNFIDVMGKVDADKNTTLSPKVPGTITRVLVAAGQQVREGQVLAEIDANAVVQGVEELKTQLRFVTEVYEKQKALWDQKIGSEIQYLSAKNNKEALEKKMATINEQVDMYKIRAPFAGIVDEVMIKVGQIGAPGMPAIRLVNFSGLKVVANVSETYISKIKQGNGVRISFPDMNKEIDGRISYAANVVDPMTRCIKVESAVSSSENLKPNMIAVLKISDYTNSNAIVVPVNAVQNSEEGQYVMVAVQKDGKYIAERRIVQVGLTYNGQTEIKGGLSTGDKLITTGFQELNNGDVIKF